MKKYIPLLFSLIFLFLSCIILEQTKLLSEKEHYSAMLEASQRTEQAFELIKQERQKKGYPVSPIDDPGKTGLIGEPYTDITTTLGNLEAKRSTTNPNIAAMITDMLIQCGLEKGDIVAVNLSSSFPCVNIATLCALDTLELNGIIINSVGASTYGANLPGFTYLDMEQLLLSNGLITNHSTWFSMGGINDQGKEMPDEVKSGIIIRLKSYGLTYLDFENLEENITYRIGLYEAQEPISCFINAGGNLLSFGGGSEMTAAKNGILMPGSSTGFHNSPGLIPYFLSRQIPVIHLLNMKSLLSTYGLPIDPIPIPPIGSGDVYYKWAYNKPLGLLLAFFNILYLFYVVKKLPKKRIPL